jgi:NAD(P)-dependent dehydrogenase (short-subunit alcohol dehydrogenase family)
MERAVVVTGAGSGIGLATAVEAARLGFTAVAAVHRPDQGGAVRTAAAEAGVEVAVEVLDVTDDAAASRVIDRVQPWALVNNAAYMNAGLLEDVSLDEARRQYDVMLFAPMRLTQLALPGMRRRGGGRIVNISSVAGELSLPFQGWYDAGKQALSSLSDALRAEVAEDAIDVVVVEPGAVATRLWDRARRELEEHRARSRQPDRYAEAFELLEALRERAVDAGEVAAVVGEVLHAGHPRVRYRVGVGAPALPLVARVVPTSVRDRMTATWTGR